MPSRERTLILTVGLPRSGKSTWSMRQMVPVVNPDSVRRAIHGQAFVQDSEPLVWGVVDTMIRSLFIAGHETVILDATNIDRATRRRWVARGGYWRTVCRLFPAGIDECIARALDSNTSYLVPVIERMAKAFELPSELPQHEGGA